MTFRIALTERGPPQFVTSADWTAHNLELPIRNLAERSIVTLARASSGVLLSPGRFVGEMRATGALLRVEPKSPTLFAAMQTLALSAQIKKARHFDPKLIESTENGGPAAAFTMCLARALDAGIPWAYLTIAKATSYPRGKIDFVRTMTRFGSRAIHHRVMVAVPERSQDGRIVQLVRTAYDCLQSAPDANNRILLDAEILISAFDQGPLVRDVSHAKEIAQELLIGSPAVSSAIRDLILASLDLIEQRYALAGGMQAIPGGTARFQNLERLWELSVLRLVECCPFLRSDAEVLDHGLRDSGLRLLRDDGPRIDPDIVLRTDSGVTGVIDAKYKLLAAGDNSATDLYQLVAYVRSSGAKFGMLVSFLDEYESAVLIGTTEEGAAIASISLSAATLLSEGEHALTRMLSRSTPLTEAVKKSMAQNLS